MLMTREEFARVVEAECPPEIRKRELENVAELYDGYVAAADFLGAELEISYATDSQGCPSLHVQASSSGGSTIVVPSQP